MAQLRHGHHHLIGLWLWLTASAWADPTQLLQAGAFAEAEAEARALLETDLEPAWRGYYLTTLAAAVGSQGRAEEGLALSEQALAAYLEAVGPDDGSLLQLYLNLAAQRFGAGDVSGSRAATAEMERLWVVNGVADDEVPLYRAQLAQHQLDWGDAEGAEERASLALAQISAPEWQARCAQIRDEAQRRLAEQEEVDREARDLGEQVDQLIIAVDQGDYAGADTLAPELLARCEAFFGADAHITGIVRAEWAAALVELSRYDQALQVLEPLSRSEDPALPIRGQGERARILQLQGRLSEARPVLERAIAEAEAVLGEVQDTQTLRTNLAQLQYESGDALGALQGFRQAQAWLTEHTPDDWESQSSLDNNLGLALAALGDAQGAHDAWWRAVEAAQDHVAPDHPLLVYPANHLSQLCTQQYQLTGEQHWLDSALEFSTFVLEARRRQLGDAHPSTQVAFNNHGLVLSAAGRLAEARTAYEAALAGTLGPQHPKRAPMLLNLALTWLDEDRARALTLAQQALSIHLLQLDLLQDHASERERLFAREAYEQALSLVLALQPDPTQAWADLLVAKGMSSRILLAQKQVRDADPALQSLADQLLAQRGTLAAAALAGEDLTSLTAQKEALERELARRSEGWRSQQDAAAPTPARVCAELAPGQLLLDWFAWGRDTLVAQRLQTTLELSVFVVDPSCRVERVDLGPVGDTGEDLARWRALLSDPTAQTARIDRIGTRVRAAWWDPLEPWLTDARSLIVSPGELGSLPWGALPTEQGYVAERWPLVMVSDPGELLRARHRPDRGALVVGGVDYDASVHASSAGPRNAPCGDAPFVPLPDTAREASEVARLLRTRPLTGADATVAAVGEAARNARVIHLSTHGYFADPDRCAEVETGPDARELWSPMLLSGLALAGANVRAPGEDGIWTAEEVAGLDLRGTELVVLSACETGLGLDFGQEGVMGLRRAFAMAGARHLVASLWQVEDAATRRLMATFHGQRRGTVAERLQAAQLTELDWQRTHLGEAHPQAWASFMATGPWR